MSIRLREITIALAMAMTCCLASAAEAQPPLACSPLCVGVAGEDELIIHRVVKLGDPLDLQVDLRADGSWRGTDDGGNELAGTWTQKNGRKYRLELAEPALDLWLALLEARKGAPVSIDVPSLPRLTLKLNKKRTRAKLKTRFEVEGEREGTGVRAGEYAFKLKTPAR